MPVTRLFAIVPILAATVVFAAPSAASAHSLPPGKNHPPTVSLRLSPDSGPRGTAFSAVASARDSDGDELSYGWQLDGKTVVKATGPEFEATLTTLGTHTFVVGVNDGTVTVTDTVTVTVVNRAPTAAITAAPGSPQTGQSIALSSASTDPDGDALACAWDLDDNGSFETAGCATSRSYAKQGTYTVGLWVDDGNGGVVSTAKSLAVANRLPVGAFVATPSNPLTKQTVTFDSGTSSDPDGSIVARAWDLDDDGNFDDGTAATATFQFLSAGPHSVRLRVTDDNAGTSVATVVVNVQNQLPAAVFTATPAASTAGDPVVFDAGQSTDPEGADIVRYEWDFDGDGTFDADTGATPSAVHAYAGGGTFTAKLRITDADGGQATTTRTLSVAARPVVATPAAQAPGPTPAAAPAPTTKPAAQIAATLRYSFTRNLISATFASLVARNLPTGATVRGTCKGGGCPSKPIAIVAKSATVSLTGLTKRKLKVGAVITVTISKTGMKSRTIKLTVRRGKDPKLS